MYLFFRDNRKIITKDSISLILSFWALASVNYICVGSGDPFLHAFELIKKLKQFSKIQNELKFQYLEIAENSSRYS